MAALTVASWTVAVLDRAILTGHPAKKRIVGTLALAGVDTYPTGGVPAPLFGTLGFDRTVDTLKITGHPGGQTTGYKIDWDRTNNKLQFYSEEVVAAGGPLLEALASEVPGPRTFDFEAMGW